MILVLACCFLFYLVSLAVYSRAPFGVSQSEHILTAVGLIFRRSILGHITYADKAITPQQFILINS